MKIYPRLKVNLIGLALVALFLRLSYWQWERHLAKEVVIKQLEQRVTLEPRPLSDLLSPAIDWSAVPYSRYIVEGTFDYDHEFVLRNRRHQDLPGVFVVTPLKLKGSDRGILVSRGFLPLQYAAREDRPKSRRPVGGVFTLLLKESSARRFLAPSDPPAGDGFPWVDEWLRVDVPAIQRQIPYPLLPVWGELMDRGKELIVPSELFAMKDARSDIMNPTARFDEMVIGRTAKSPDAYPVPVFDTIVPAARHLGYVFEWAAMALFTIIICLVIQLRPARTPVADGETAIENLADTPERS